MRVKWKLLSNCFLVSSLQPPPCILPRMEQRVLYRNDAEIMNGSAGFLMRRMTKGSVSLLSGCLGLNRAEIKDARRTMISEMTCQYFRPPCPTNSARPPFGYSLN